MTESATISVRYECNRFVVARGRELRVTIDQVSRLPDIEKMFGADELVEIKHQLVDRLKCLESQGIQITVYIAAVWRWARGIA